MRSKTVLCQRSGALILLALVASGCASAPPSEGPAAKSLQLSLTDTKGEAHDLDAALARGETVALVFWQTWCKSCQEEAPRIAAASATEAGAIHFVSVVPGREGTVDEAKVEETRAAWGYQGFPLVRDRDLSLSRALGVRGTPTIVVLGRDRKVLYQEHRPPADWKTLRGAPIGADPLGVPGKPATKEDCPGGVCPIEGDS